MSSVIGVPDPYKMQKVKAFVVLRPDVQPTEEVKDSIYQLCKRNIAHYAMKEMDPASMFDVKKVHEELPEDARIFMSFPCDVCGEMTAEPMLRLSEDKKLCLDCYKPYERFR